MVDLQDGVGEAELGVKGVQIGEPYESTITMVSPAPVMERPVAAPLYSGFRSYATRY
jgi:hypothetical protein